MRGRYYSPLWHRFVSSDRGADPNGLNQYAYVGGAPFTAVDPSGMYWTVRYLWAGPGWIRAINTKGVVEWGPAGGGGYWYPELTWVDYDTPNGPGYGPGGPGSGLGGGLGSGPGGGPALGGIGGGPGGPKAKKITQKDIDRAACEAYRALAKQFGGIPTGRTEVGGKLYLDNGSVNFSDFVSYTAPVGKRPSLPNLMGVSVPGVPVGYIHTHPSYHTRYKDGSKTPPELVPWLNVSSGDIYNLGQSFKHELSSGYMTAPELWETNQIIRFQTEDSISATYELIDCSRYW
jgi:hypothetical protein